MHPDASKPPAPQDPPGRKKEIIDEPPPFLRTWPRVYIMILAWLAVTIGALYLFARAFAP